MRKIAVVGVGVLVALGASILDVSALTGTFTEIEPPVPDAAVRGWDINEAGQVAGTAYFADGRVTGFLRDADGTYRELPPPPGPFDRVVDAYAVNGAGDVVGVGTNEISIHPHTAILWPATGGTLDLGALPGDIESYAWDINDAGFIVGTSRAPLVFELSAWVHDPDVGVLVDLGTLPGGSGDVGVAAINNDGVAAGFAHVPGTGDVGFTWTEAGGMVALPLPPGGMSSRPLDINDRGQILGRSWVWDPVDGYTVLAVGGYESVPASINDDGLVVGSAYAYLPESDTYRSAAVAWDPSTGEASVFAGVPDGGGFTAVNNRATAVGHLGAERSSETFVGQITEDPVTVPPTPPAPTPPAAAPVVVEPAFTG